MLVRPNFECLCFAASLSHYCVHGHRSTVRPFIGAWHSLDSRNVCRTMSPCRPCTATSFRTLRAPGFAAPSAWVGALAGAAEFEQTLAMDNTFEQLPLLQLQWYDALAAALVKRHYDGDTADRDRAKDGDASGRISAVIGSPGAGKSMSRNLLAKRILESTKGPVAIVFTTTPNSSAAVPVVVVTRSKQGAPLEARIFPDASKVDLWPMLREYRGGASWCLADVSRGELVHATNVMRHIVYFTSNHIDLGRRLREVGKLSRGRVKLFFVPKARLRECVAWYQLVSKERTVADTKKAQLELWMVKYGYSLRVLSILVAAKENFEACEKEMAAELAENLKAEGVCLLQLAEDPDVHLEHIGGDAALCVKSTFSTTNPTFAHAGVEWRSKWVKEQVFLWAWAAAAHQANALTSRYRAALTCDVRACLFEDFMLAQFRVHMRAEGMLFTFHTTQKMGEATGDLVGLTSQHGAVPTPINGAVAASNCRWFQDSGKWDDRDACLERGVVKHVIRRGSGRPVLLMPFNPDYPGLDAVLVWKQGGVWKALLIQVTLSPRHAASAGGEVVFACWVEWLTASGVPAANIGVLYCVKPEDHPYSWQPVGGLAVAQYSMSWTTGRHKRKRSSKRTTTEAQCGIEQRLRAGGNVSVVAWGLTVHWRSCRLPNPALFSYQRSQLLNRFTKSELMGFAAARRLSIKGSKPVKAAIIAAIVENFDKQRRRRLRRLLR